MLDVIRYLPFEWRKRRHFCKPGGSSFAKAKRVDCSVGGSRLSFMAPKHRSERGGQGEIKLYLYRDALAQDLHHYNAGVMTNDCWRHKTIFLRNWTYWGPWMTGAKAELSMGVTVIGGGEEHPYEGVSFFHPRVFESVLVDFLNASYGRHLVRCPGAPAFQGPESWETYGFLPVFSASCIIYRVGVENQAFDPEYLFFFPITEQHFVEISFRRDIYSEDKTGAPTFDMNPVINLQEAIFNSLELELSPEAQAEWERVKSQCPDMSLTKEFAPLKWPVKPS